MLASKPRLMGHNIATRGGYVVPAPIYQVIIYPNEDNAGGYWAKCLIDENNCAFTDGHTIAETEINMFESVSLMLRDDYPNITDYSLAFTVAGKPYDE